MAMNTSHGSTSRTSSTPATSSSLRPRVARLISGFDEGDETAVDPTTAPIRRIASPVPSPYASRSASPIPSSHPSRSASAFGKQRVAYVGDARSNTSAGPTKKASNSSLATLWGTSWTAIQGIATEFLGSEDEDRSSPQRRRKNSKSGPGRPATSVPPKAWGPTSGSLASTIAVGSREEREALVRAQKRKELLSGSTTEYADSLGRFKRRTSEEGASASAPPGANEDRDALVYIHHVLPSDTLAGITIRYNCSAQTLRKANRMWPNDSVQIKKTLLLPVGSCSVKGKPCEAPDQVDLLSGHETPVSEEATPTSANPRPNGASFDRRSRNESISSVGGRPASSVISTSSEAEQPYTHDSWVMLPNATKPTQIGRLSQRALGYFPPARRKSQSYSDLDTPSTSMDIPRNSLFDSTATSPSRTDPSQRPRRSRRVSNASNGYFPSYLAGPGGVGTMNRNVRNPGPAQDGLNKLFASHLPDVGPPPNQQRLYMPDIPTYSDDLSRMATPLASGAQTPNNIGIENIGGALEGWFRKVAKSAQTALEPSERREAARASVGVPGRGAGGVGDLIEMADAFEIGGDEGDDEPEQAERGRQGSSIGPLNGPSSSTISGSYFGQDQVRARARSGTSSASTKRVKDD